MKTRYDLFIVLDGRHDPQDVQEALIKAFGEDYVDMSVSSKWTIIDPKNKGDMELDAEQPMAPMCKNTSDGM